MPGAGDGLWVYGPWLKGSRLEYGGVVVDASKASRNYAIYLNKIQKIDCIDLKTRRLAAYANTLRGKAQTDAFKYNADIRVNTKDRTAVLVSRGIRTVGWVEVFCPYGRSFHI